MTLKNLLDTISMLQKEMGREQATFNSLSAQLASLNKNSRQYKQISKEMNTSQTRLTMLMNRSMKCFQQQGNQHVKTPAPAPPGVQRHSSNVEPKEGSSGNNVQRRHSAKISATEGENIKSGFDAKTTTQNTGPKKPVILQPIVNNSKMPSNGRSGSKVSTANGVSDTSTVSTSVSSVVKTTVSPPVTSLTNSTSSTAKTSSTKSVGITPVTNTTPVTSSSDSAKSTSILNVGVKNTVQNLERKSVVNMPKVVTNGAAARSTTSNTSGVVKPNSDKTVISVTSSSSKSIVTSVVTKSTTTVSKTVSSGTKSVTSSVQESSETKKIPEAPVAPTLKKVSQPSKYSRPPINQPVDPREQMLSEIRNFKRPANASEVEPLRKSVTEVKLGITQGRQDQQKKVATIPQQKAVPVSAQQKAVPVSAQQKKTAPFSVPQMSNVASPAENQQVTSSVSVKTISSEKTKETEKKEKEIVVLESKSSEDQTVRLEQIKVSDDKIVEDKPKVTQVSTKVTDNSEAESEIPALMTTEDSTESEGEQSEKYVSSVTFTHKPLKSAEAVKPKTKALSSASSADVTPGPPTAAVTTPAEPKQEDQSHLSETTRLRMQRVRELEQQRLQRVLARSLTTAQQPHVSQQDTAAESRSPNLRSPNVGSRSPSLRSSGRARFSTPVRISRTMSEDRNDVVVPRLPTRAEDSDNNSQASSENPNDSDQNEASAGATGRNSVFLKKLDELASAAENDTIKARYLRLKELEEMRLSGKSERGESNPPFRGSTTLGRSASVNEHTSSDRLSRRNSDQVRRRHGSPIMTRRVLPSNEDSSETQLSRASSASNLYTPDLSSLDRMFSDRRQEGLRRIEEISKLRQQGIRSISMDVDPVERSARERFLESLNVHPTRSNIEPLSSVLFPPIQYSSIDERLESVSPRYGSDTSLNRVGMGSFDDVRRVSGDNSAQTTQIYRDTSGPGLTYVDEEGHSQWITPSSPLYKQMKAPEKPTPVDLKLEERKKRSLLAREGLEHHFLTECFDPDISFEERIGLIREKLYGSKVLIPSDKRRAMTDRGCPDGSSDTMKDSSASGGNESEGNR